MRCTNIGKDGAIFVVDITLSDVWWTAVALLASVFFLLSMMVGTFLIHGCCADMSF